MGRGRGKGRVGRRRGAMGRTRGWDGQRCSVLERLESQKMKEGLLRGG